MKAPQNTSHKPLTKECLLMMMCCSSQSFLKGNLSRRGAKGESGVGSSITRCLPVCVLRDERTVESEELREREEQRQGTTEENSE